MRPFFPYYGSAWNKARYLPRPYFKFVREPFAGSAGYSLFYNCYNVELIEKDPIVVGVWEYLINASAEEIMDLPEMPEVGDNVDNYHIPQEARWLIGFWLNRGSSQPKKSRTAYSARSDKAQLNWGNKAKERIVTQIPYISEWKITEGEYDCGSSSECTWLIDPPYIEKGKFYRKNDINYAKLAKWSLSRPGQTIVLEGANAEWLPFSSIGSLKTSKDKAEAKYWTNLLHHGR